MDKKRHEMAAKLSQEPLNSYWLCVIRRHSFAVRRETLVAKAAKVAVYKVSLGKTLLKTILEVNSILECFKISCLTPIRNQALVIILLKS